MSSTTALRNAYVAEIDSHLALVSAATRMFLRRLIQDEDSPGSTDPPALGVLLAIVRGLQPRLMLQLGTHVGFSALCIADVLEHNPYVKGELVSVDPNEQGQVVAGAYLAEASLAPRVRFVTGFSTEAWVAEELCSFGQFELTYLIRRIPTAEPFRSSICCSGRPVDYQSGLLVAHDAAAKRRCSIRRARVACRAPSVSGPGRTTPHMGS